MKNQTITFSMLTAMMKKIEESYSQRGIQEVNLSGHDFYLSLGTDAMFDVYEKLPDPMPIGSLDDDLKELSKLVRSSEPFATAVDLERLGNLLRAMSEVLSK
jgi:hypothetical protein